MSAGSAGLVGSCWSRPHAAITITSTPSTGTPSNEFVSAGEASTVRNTSTSRPALEQSKMRMEGVPSQDCKSYTERDPHLAVGGRARHAVAVEVKEQPVLAVGVRFAQQDACAFDVVRRRVEARAVLGPRLPHFVLSLRTRTHAAIVGRAQAQDQRRGEARERVREREEGR
eukprot:4579125-Pleurochrysis_carterae.AAC.2